MHFPVWKSIPHSYLLYLNVVMLYDNWYQQYQQELLCRPNGFMSLPHQTVNKIWSRCPMDIKMLSVGNYTQLCRARSFCILHCTNWMNLFNTRLFPVHSFICYQTCELNTLAQMAHWPKTWNDLLWRSEGQRSRSHKAVAGFGVEKERYHQVTDTTIPILWSVIRYRYWPWQHTECNIS